MLRIDPIRYPPVVVYQRIDTRPASSEKKQRIKHLHAQGMTNVEIAKDVELSANTVAHHLRDMGLKYNTRFLPKDFKPTTGELKASPPANVDWLAVCRNVLGKRLEIKNIKGQLAYYLDGLMKPITNVIDAANAELIGSGMKPIGRKNGSYV